jgi:hypothetical protein
VTPLGFNSKLFHLINMNYCNVKKVKSLCFNWESRHEGVLGVWRYSSIHSLTSALHGGEWSAPSLGHFTARERAALTHWIRGWVGSRALLDAVVKSKIPSPRWESNSRKPIVQPVAQRYTEWAITDLIEMLNDVKLVLLTFMAISVRTNHKTTR